MIYAVVGWLVRLKTRSVVVAHVRYYNVLLWDGVRFVTSQTPGAMVFPNNELLSACVYMHCGTGVVCVATVNISSYSNDATTDNLPCIPTCGRELFRFLKCT